MYCITASLPCFCWLHGVFSHMSSLTRQTAHELDLSHLFIRACWNTELCYQTLLSECQRKELQEQTDRRAINDIMFILFTIVSIHSSIRPKEV